MFLGQHELVIVFLSCSLTMDLRTFVKSEKWEVAGKLDKRYTQIWHSLADIAQGKSAISALDDEIRISHRIFAKKILSVHRTDAPTEGSRDTGVCWRQLRS